MWKKEMVEFQSSSFCGVSDLARLQILSRTWALKISGAVTQYPRLAGSLDAFCSASVSTNLSNNQRNCVQRSFLIYSRCRINVWFHIRMLVIKQKKFRLVISSEFTQLLKHFATDYIARNEWLSQPFAGCCSASINACSNNIQVRYRYNQLMILRRRVYRPAVF